MTETSEVTPKALTKNRKRIIAAAAAAAVAVVALSVSFVACTSQAEEPVVETLSVDERIRQIHGDYNRIMADDALIDRQAREIGQLARDGCPAEHRSISKAGAVYCDAPMPKKKTGIVIDSGWTQAEIEREYRDIVEESRRLIEEAKRRNGTDYQIGQGYPPRDIGTDAMPNTKNGGR